MTSGFGTLAFERTEGTNGGSLDASFARTNSSHSQYSFEMASTGTRQLSPASNGGNANSANTNLWSATDGMITYRVPFTTSTTPIRSRFDENEREYRAQVLMGQVFGAFYQMCVRRKSEEGLSRKKLGERMGRGKTRLPQMLREPGNWSLRTIAEFANALEMDFHFFLSDRKHPGRIAKSTGIEEPEAPTIDLKPIISERTVQRTFSANLPSPSADTINFKRSKSQDVLRLIQYEALTQHGLS
jgi:hypothetical protein